MNIIQTLKIPMFLFSLLIVSSIAFAGDDEDEELLNAAKIFQNLRRDIADDYANKNNGAFVIKQVNSSKRATISGEKYVQVVYWGYEDKPEWALETVVRGLGFSI